MLDKCEWVGSEAGFDAIAELIVGLDPRFLDRCYPEGVLQGASPLCYLVEELPEDVVARRRPVPLRVRRGSGVLGPEESKAFRQVIVRLDASLRRLALCRGHTPHGPCNVN